MPVADPTMPACAYIGSPSLHACRQVQYETEPRGRTGAWPALPGAARRCPPRCPTFCMPVQLQGLAGQRAASHISCVLTASTQSGIQPRTSVGLLSRSVIISSMETALKMGKWDTLRNKWTKVADCSTARHVAGLRLGVAVRGRLACGSSTAVHVHACGNLAGTHKSPYTTLPGGPVHTLSMPLASSLAPTCAAHRQDHRLGGAV